MTNTQDIRPGQYVLTDCNGRVLRISDTFMSAGPGKVYQVLSNKRLKRLTYA